MPSAPSAASNGLSPHHTCASRPDRQQKATRILRMPLRRHSMDDEQEDKRAASHDTVRSSIAPSAETQAEARATQKRVTTPAEQLRHCLKQYEILKKQVLCAELTQTTPPDEEKLRQSAATLVRRITRLRKQIASSAHSVSDRQKIQLTMKAATVRILKAFADAGKSPSSLVERALWNDRDVQDAALLLKLQRPSATSPKT